MKLKYFVFVPIILLIVSVVTSVIAFQQSKKLDGGYIYVNDNNYTPVYSGEYFAIIGNIFDEEYYILIESLEENLYIATFDSNQNVIREFELVIKITDGEYDSSILVSQLSEEKIIIDEMDDYLFRVSLDAENEYSFSLTRIDSEGEKINVALVNMAEHVYNLKSLMESVSFTTLIFAVVSGFTILVIHFLKKR